MDPSLATRRAGDFARASRPSHRWWCSASRPAGAHDARARRPTVAHSSAWEPRSSSSTPTSLGRGLCGGEFVRTHNFSPPRASRAAALSRLPRHGLPARRGHTGSTTSSSDSQRGPTVATSGPVRPSALRELVHTGTTTTTPLMFRPAAWWSGRWLPGTQSWKVGRERADVQSALDRGPERQARPRRARRRLDRVAADLDAVTGSLSHGFLGEAGVVLGFPPTTADWDAARRIFGDLLEVTTGRHRIRVLRRPGRPKHLIRLVVHHAEDSSRRRRPRDRRSWCGIRAPTAAHDPPQLLAPLCRPVVTYVCAPNARQAFKARLRVVDSSGPTASAGPRNPSGSASPPSPAPSRLVRRSTVTAQHAPGRTDSSLIPAPRRPVRARGSALSRCRSGTLRASRSPGARRGGAGRPRSEPGDPRLLRRLAQRRVAQGHVAGSQSPPSWTTADPRYRVGSTSRPCVSTDADGR